MAHPEIRLDNLPLGLCPECLEKMLEHAKYEAYAAPGGTRILKVYCWHRQAGALGIVRPGKPVRWKIETPIDAIRWDETFKVRAATIAGAIEQLQQPGPAPSQAH